MLPLAYLGETVLLKKATEVPKKDFNSAKVQTFVQEFIAAANRLPAAGLAAPQVFKSYRMFCLIIDKEDLKYKVLKSSKKGDSSKLITNNVPFLMINPVLEFPDKEKEYDAEACLSIPYYYGIIERFKSVQVTFNDLQGETYVIEAADFMARVIQHEFDHLNGILFLDRVRSTADLHYMGDGTKNHKI